MDKKSKIYPNNLVSIDYIRVNVDGVVGNKIDKDDGGVRIYGTVIVLEGGFAGFSGNHIVYHRASVKSERLLGPFLSMTGPYAAVHGLDAFSIGVHVWVKFCDHDGTETTKEISNGVVGYLPYNRSVQSFERVVLGKYGSVSVGFSVMKFGLITTVNILMVSTNENESPAQIYGTIKACRSFSGQRTLYDNSMHTWVDMYPPPSGSSTTMLFDKSADEWVQLKPQHQHSSIPLYVTIPVSEDSDFTIELDLWDHSSGLQIVLGSLPFTPISGTHTKNITGEYEQVLQVSITCKYQ